MIQNAPCEFSLFSQGAIFTYRILKKYSITDQCYWHLTNSIGVYIFMITSPTSQRWRNTVGGLLTGVVFCSRFSFTAATIPPASTQSFSQGVFLWLFFVTDGFSFSIPTTRAGFMSLFRQRRSANDCFENYNSTDSIVTPDDDVNRSILYVYPLIPANPQLRSPAPWRWNSNGYTGHC